MKKLFKQSLISVLTLSMFMGTISSVSAQETKPDNHIANVANNVVVENEVTEDILNELDQYVVIIDNQYVLALPEGYVIDSEVLDDLTVRMEAINEYVAQENLTIDTESKVATQTIRTRKYGVNSISFSWNSIIFKLDAGMVETLAKAGAAGAVAVIIGAFPPIVAFIAAHPIAGLAIGAIVASLVDSIISSGIIKDGLEIHYNFFLLKVTVCRKQ